MNANTRYFGEVSYEKSDILLLPQGLFGFEQDKEYLLIHLEDDNDAFLCMQSLHDENLAFIITNPFHFFPDYHPVIAPEDMEALGLTDNSDVSFYTLCVLQEVITESTMNLKCPIVINPSTRRARQVILEDPAYQFKHYFKDAAHQTKEGDSC